MIRLDKRLKGKCNVHVDIFDTSKCIKTCLGLHLTDLNTLITFILISYVDLLSRLLSKSNNEILQPDSECATPDIVDLTGDDDDNLSSARSSIDFNSVLSKPIKMNLIQSDLSEILKKSEPRLFEGLRIDHMKNKPIFYYEMLPDKFTK